MTSQWFVIGMACLQIAYVLCAGCNWSFYQHYEHKGCSPVLGMDGCPVRFDCKPLTENDRNTCLHGGKRYKDKEVIQSTDPCDDCTCTTAWNSGDAVIECAEVDCPEWVTKNKSCYMGYNSEQCCPSEICPSEKEIVAKTCILDGKTYKLGQYIVTQERCKSCICTEQWTGLGGPGCSDVDCKLGINVRQLRSGCLPIYMENGCCPIEFNCGGIYGATPVTFPVTNRDNLCHHHGQYYQPGSTAYLQSDKYQCVSCTCTVPPDFTCVKRACPPPPGKNCKARYGHCCPNYECS